ncbi:type VI secretion system secreted protein VgrG [Variovorax boronicumulans]|uniref:type VI secretion system Vgr family protein n=1 Tax=Variovorax boronicumulans TaxID=436515 RepID=UPI0024738500|nr:type VI secretion system tip protein TssI/VgrG [Variovorax boronicumulans]MDH6168207.1 type VI secretion system secreted protein VgrG [Variovorax boronicumulans]
MFSSFSTGSRTISVGSPAMPSLLGNPALVFKSLDGTEALGELFQYTVRLQTPDSPMLTEYVTANVPVKQLVGKEFGIGIELDGKGFGARRGAGTREINGLVTSARFLRHENRRGIYEIVLRPWLALATHTSDYRIFQNKTPLEIVEEVLADYNFPVEKRITHRYPKRGFQVQYGEKDFEFITRLMQEFGIYYFFEHKEGAHRLVLVDDLGAHRKSESEAYQAISYHPPGHKIDEEYCDNFCSIENLEPGQWTTDDFDFTKPRARLRQTSRMPRNTGNSAQEIYKWPGDYSDPDEGRDLARTRMEATGAPGSRGRGSGNLRGVVTGCTFSLVNYPQDAANQAYLVIASTLRLHESGHASGQEDYVCRTDFEVQPANKIFRSPQTQPKPRTTGPQTAIVTGPSGQEIWTDEYGRIKLSFHWNRYCTKDENSSCWIRVASTWAGSQFGGMQVPRMGQEVIVDFENGDPDRPIVTGRVYNRLNMPPRQLPGQKNLSGFRSRELSADGSGLGARGNHLELDDHPGKIQAQLKSDHQCSSLSLGYIGRIDGTSGRKDDRGQGAELRTDGHGAIRAAKGLLVTTQARPNAQAHITDLGETVDRLTAARDLHESQSQTAQEAKAHEHGDQDVVTKALKEQNDAIKGKNIRGHADDGFPELDEPHLVLASSAGIHSTAGSATHIASITHTALSSGGHTSISAGKGFLVSVKEAVRLFAYRAIRLTAATAGIDIVALQDSIKLMAKLDIKQEANRISITAKEEILINGGSSYTRWTASGIEHGTSGAWREQAASHSLVGPMNMEKLLRMEGVSPDDKYSVRFATLGGDEVFQQVAMAGLPYKILDERQAIKAEGVIPENGRLPRVIFETPDEATLIVGEEVWAWSPVPTTRLATPPFDTSEEDTDEASNEGRDDEAFEIENSRYATPATGSGLNYFLSESAVEAHLRHLI